MRETEIAVKFFGGGAPADTALAGAAAIANVLKRAGGRGTKVNVTQPGALMGIPGGAITVEAKNAGLAASMRAVLRNEADTADAPIIAVLPI